MQIGEKTGFRWGFLQRLIYLLLVSVSRTFARSSLERAILAMFNGGALKFSQMSTWDLVVFDSE